MTTALTKRDSATIAATTFGEAMKMSEVLAKSKLIPDELKGSAPNVLATLLAGQELGLGPMTSLRSIHVIKGRTVMSADLMVALVLGSGACEYFKQSASDATKAIYVTKRRGGSEQRASFTIEEAKKAGLIKSGGNWDKHPAAMLRARAKSILARDAYPDIMHGVYSHDEIDAEQSEVEYTAPVIEMAAEASPIIEAEVVGEEIDSLDLEVKALAAEIESGELGGEVIKRLHRLPDGAEKDQLRELYKARKASE